MFKKIILMTTAVICFMGMAKDAVAMDQNLEEPQTAASNAVVVNRPMRALIGNISKLPYPQKSLFYEIFSYLDHHDATSFAEAMHFAPLGEGIRRQTERFYQLRVDAIVANTPEIHRAHITALLEKQNVLNAPFRSLIISGIGSAAGLFDTYQVTSPEVFSELRRITTVSDFSPTALRAASYTQHRDATDILKAIQIGSYLKTVSPDHVAGYMTALCNLLGCSAQGNGVPDIDTTLLDKSKIIPALIAVPHARLKHVVSGALSFMRTAFDVNPGSGWPDSQNKLPKNSYPAVCADVLKSICQIPAEHLEDYLFVAEIIMHVKKHQATSVDETKSILTQLIQIPYGSLETIVHVVQDFLNNPLTEHVPISNVLKYLEQTPSEEIGKNVGNLMRIFSDDAEGNIKIIKSLNSVERVKRQHVLDATFQFMTVKPNPDYRAHIVKYFDSADSDQLEHYTGVAHEFMTPEFDETTRAMVINELMLTNYVHLDDVSRAALDFLAGHDDRSAPMRTRTIRFLREIIQDKVKGPYFQHYVDTWRALNDLLKKDHVAEKCLTFSGEVTLININFDSSTQILRDLQDIPYNHLDGIRRVAEFFVRAYPHLKSNKTIISALGQAEFDHLDEYINAVSRIVNVPGAKPTDIMEGQFGQSILRILANIKYDILPFVVDAATQKIAESSAAGTIVSFDAIETIINKCEKVEESKKKRYYY